MKEKLKSFWNQTKARVTSAFLRSGVPEARQEHDEELFVERTRPRPFPLAVFFTTFKLMLLLVVLFGCAGIGLVLGVAKAYVDTTPELDVAQLTKSDRTSYIYDKDGALISTFAGIEYRDWVNIEDVPDMLKNAIIAIEDVRFYRHSGVDYKRLFAAVVGSLSASSDAGGSTLTQQLVKNKLLTSEVSYRRKIQEVYLALQIEKTIEKDDILEAYLNDVYLGQSNYGMKAAAKDYFGKELSELSIRECAMLAGMIQGPNTTDPRKNTYKRTYGEDSEKAGQNKMDITDARTDKVISRMYQAGFINKEQRDAALEDSVYIMPESQRSSTDDMLYFVEYAVRDIVTHLLKEREMLDTTANRAAIESELSRGGYSIYLTVDSDMQHTVQDTLANWEDYPELRNKAASVRVTVNSDGTTIEEDEPQAAAVIIDQRTGELRAIVGGREAPVIRKGWNRAYQSATEVGSSIKPLTVYGPALDLGLSPATVIANIPDPIEGWNTETGYPAIGESKYEGLVTVRRGVVSSLNVVAARTLMEEVTPSLAAKYLVNLGVDPSRVKATGSGLSLGTTGITPIEMAGAFATIANQGEYLEPLSFTRVVDGNGGVILDADDIRETRQVYKPTTAYMLVDMLTDAVKSGTGTRAKISGRTVAGKTGTNSDYSSAYFAGMTGYYTAVVYVGHDLYTEKLADGSSGGRVAAPIWRAFMEKILSGMPDKQIIDASPVELGLVRRTVCTVSGMLASEACYYDAAGYLPVTEWFAGESAPTDSCNMHVMANVCTASGQAASSFCPISGVEYKSLVLVRTNSRFAKYEKVILAKYLTNAVFTDLTAEQFYLYANTNTCQLHTPFGGSSGGLSSLGGYDTLTANAESLINEVTVYLNAAQNISDTDRSTLESGVDWLRYYLDGRNTTFIQSYYERLKYNYEVIYAAHPPAATAGLTP